MASQEQDKSPLTENFCAELARVGLPKVVIARGIGVTEKQVTRWCGGQLPRWDSAVKIARYFNRAPEWFYTDHSSEPRERRRAA